MKNVTMHNSYVILTVENVTIDRSDVIWTIEDVIVTLYGPSKT